MKQALSKFTEKNFLAVNTLADVAQPIFREFLWRIASHGIYIRVIDAKRTLEDQWRLYLVGRPWLSGGTQGSPVTWIAGDGSMHVWGLAIDIAVLHRIGPITYEAIWSGNEYDTLGKIALELGITWGYAKWGVDKPHFHYEEGLLASDPVSTLRGGCTVKEPQFESVELPSVLARAKLRLKNNGIIV